jgi:tetratricopeptide (TPR) repeat protein
MEGGGPHGFRLAAELRDAGDFEGTERLAELCESSGAIDHAYTLFDEVALFASSPKVRIAALTHLSRWGQVARVAEALEARDPLIAQPLELIQILLDASAMLPLALHERVIELAAMATPERRMELLRGLYELRRADGRFLDAVEAFRRLAETPADPKERAVLHIELGELCRSSQPEQAREAFERALVEEPKSVAAVANLLGMCNPVKDAQRFIALAEKLVEMEGPLALAPFHEAMAGAYQKLGRPGDAYRLLSELGDSPERLERRATLAASLGLTGEALQLREQLTEDPAQLEEILRGYVTENLVPFSVRLATKLIAQGPLSNSTNRLLAERLAPTAQGAALAIQLWPELLRAKMADADGWTLFSEALRLAGRKTEAVIADGFGAALTFSLSPAETVRIERAIQPIAGELPVTPRG